MPRKLLKRYLPDSQTLQRHPHLRRFGVRLHDPNLWHLNRRSISGAAAVGLFCAFLPLPGQMLVAAALAIAARVNLAASVALVWITNPITIPPLFYGTYILGTWLLGIKPTHINVEWSHETLLQMESIWKPLFLGSLVTGLISAALGYTLVRFLWRLHVINRLQRSRNRPPRQP